MKKLLSLLLLCSAVYGVKCETLYILHDAGETMALEDVLNKAEANHNDYCVFAQGIANRFVQANPALKTKMITVDLDEKVEFDWKRDALLSDKSITAILEKVEPLKVVSGVGFEYQGQLLKAFEKRGAHTYAFWDNINTSGTDSYFSTAKKVAAVAQTLLMPSDSFLKTYPHALVVGNPALEKVPNPLPARPTNLPLRHPLIVWVGGYGDDYNAALKAFIEGANTLSPYMIVLCYHPKYGGVVERELLEHNPRSNVFIFDSNKLPSFEAIAHADYVVCHQSTAGLQAALGGKKVFYLTPEGQCYTNALIEQNVTPQVSTIAELKERIENSLGSSVDILELLQVPKNGVDRLYQILHAKNGSEAGQ